MVGDERERMCRRCANDVYDVSSMTSADADLLVGKTDSEPNEGYYLRVDGRSCRTIAR